MRREIPKKPEPDSSPLLKGVSELLTLTILLAVVIAAIVIALTTSQPTVNAALSSADIKNAENIINVINDNIKEVSREGSNSTRIVTFTAPKKFETIPEEDAVQFSTASSPFEYLTRTFRNNIVYVTGNDVNCAEQGANADGRNDLVIENQFIKGVFLSVKRSTPYSAYDTANTVMQVTEKTKNNTIIFANSSAVIDDDPTTTAGNGYSEIPNTGLGLPFCQVHFFMNSTLDYDIYYKLYAGADFFVVEVRNIR